VTGAASSRKADVGTHVGLTARRCPSHESPGNFSIFRKIIEVAAQVSQPPPFGGYKLARAAETGKAGRLCGRWNIRRFYGAAPASETDSTVRPGPFQGFSPTP